MLCLQFCQEIAGDVPLKVINDGEVTALAAVQKIKAGNVMGISIGQQRGCWSLGFPQCSRVFLESNVKSPQAKTKSQKIEPQHNQDNVCYPLLSSILPIFGRLTLLFFGVPA